MYSRLENAFEFEPWRRMHKQKSYELANYSDQVEIVFKFQLLLAFSTGVFPRSLPSPSRLIGLGPKVITASLHDEGVETFHLLDA